MPLIPAEYVGTNSFPDRPPQAEISPDAYGRDASALASVGGEVGDLGSRLLQARKSAMEHDMTSNAQTADAQWLPKTVENLRQNFAKKDQNGNPLINPDGSTAYNPTGFADALKAQMDQRVNDNVNSMPTGDAQRMYRQKTQEMLNSAYRGAYDWENQTRVTSMLNNMETRARINGNNIINSPAPYESTLAELDRLKDEANNASGPGQLMHPGEAEKFYNSHAKTAIDSMFAAYSKDPGLAKEGMAKINDIIANQDPNSSKISGLVDLRDLESYQTRLGGVIQQGYKRDDAHFDNQYKSLMAGLNSTDPKVSGMVKEQDVHSMALQALDMAPRKGTDWASERVMGLTMGVAYKNARDFVADTPESQRDAYENRMINEYQKGLRDLGVDPEAASRLGLDKVSAMTQKYDSMWKQTIQARKADLGKYIEDTHPNMPGFINNGVPDAARIQARAVIAENLHERSGVLLQNSERSGMISTLKQAAEQDPSAAAAHLEQFKSSQGEFSQKVMGELTGSRGGLPHYFMDALNASSPDVAKEIIDLGGKNGADLEKAARLDKESGFKDVEASVNAAWAGPAKTISAVGISAHNSAVSNDMKNIVLRKAIVYKGQGQSADEAAKNATDDLFYRDYHIINNTAYMPREIGGRPTRPDVIDGAMQAVRNAPPEGFVLPGNSIGLDADQRTARIKQGLHDGRWITDNSNDKDNPQKGSRAIFMVPQKRGGSTVWAPLLHTDGTKVSVDYAKESLDPSPDALNNARRFWEPKIGPDGMPIQKDPHPQMFHVAPMQEEAPKEQSLQEQSIKSDKIKPGASPVKGTDASAAAPGRGLASTAGDDLLGGPEAFAGVANEGGSGELPQDVKSAVNTRQIPASTFGPMAPSDAAATKARIQANSQAIKHIEEQYAASPEKQVAPGVSTGTMTQTVSVPGSGGVAPLTSEQYEKYGKPLIEASHKYGMDPQIMANLARAESSFTTNAKSGTGAKGMMQFDHATAVKYGLIKEVNGAMVDLRNDAVASIEAGVHYMSDLYSKFGSYEKALAAYNAGPKVVQMASADHGANWIDHLGDYKVKTSIGMLYTGSHTRNYVNKIMEK